MDFEAAAAASQKQNGGGLSLFDVGGGATAAAKGSSVLQTTRAIDTADAKAETANSIGESGKQCPAELAGKQVPVTAAAAAGHQQPPQLQQLGGLFLAQQQNRELVSESSNSSSSMLAMAQKCTRTAKNGREQQRAQKISDVIDQLKATLDKANFTDGSSSKLHVLMSCESYLRSLKDKVRCYEMEAKLRETARRHYQQSPPPSDNGASSSATASAAASPKINSKIKNWAEKNSPTRGRAATPATSSTASSSGTSSGAGETSRMDTGDDCSTSGGGSGSSITSSSSCRSNKRALYMASSSSSDDDENNLGGDNSSAGRPTSDSGGGGGGSSGGGGGGGVLGIAGVAPRVTSSITSNSAADNSSSTGSDGDTGSSDSGGGSTSAGTTDSASQGYTDTTSRGFTTDSSFSGYTGSMGSGDAASADGGSDESEEGTTGARMRVVNYFDIFRLSNVPMAIADKTGALADVNDAMRGFGRIHQDTVKSLTVGSLVAPESSKALKDAMSSMLAASSTPQDPLAPPVAGAQPFLANAGIGNRPTLLTVSLVYDESGEPSAFHIALIPRNTGTEADGGGDAGFVAPGQRGSTEYDAGAPEFSVQKKLGQKAGEEGVADEAACAGKRGPGRTWDAGGQNKSQKRRAGMA